MPARRPSGRESKWAETQRRIPHGPVKNNPPPAPSLGGSDRPFSLIYSRVNFFVFFLSLGLRLLIVTVTQSRAEQSGAPLSGACSSCSRRGSSSALRRGPVSLSESQRKHACFTAADTRGLFPPKRSLGLRRKEERHWTGCVNRVPVPTAP